MRFHGSPVRAWPRTHSATLQAMAKAQTRAVGGKWRERTASRVANSASPI